MQILIKFYYLYGRSFEATAIIGLKSLYSHWKQPISEDFFMPDLSFRITKL